MEGGTLGMGLGEPFIMPPCGPPIMPPCGPPIMPPCAPFIMPEPLVIPFCIILDMCFCIKSFMRLRITGSAIISLIIALHMPTMSFEAADVLAAWCGAGDGFARAADVPSVTAATVIRAARRLFTIFVPL